MKSTPLNDVEEFTKASRVTLLIRRRQTLARYIYTEDEDEIVGK